MINPDYDHTIPYVPRSKRKEWAAIGLHGKLYVQDDGTCQVNGYCCPGLNGVATASAEKTDFLVMERVEEDLIRVYVK